MSGRTLPTIEVINEPLVKIVVPGIKPSDHTPYFAKLSDLEALIESGESLSNKLGLPIASESRYYDVYAIYPKGAVEVFASEVAPTSELDGRWQKEGGARQYLVPNRHQFSEPVLERRLADHISLRHAVPPLELPPALSPSMRTLGRVAVAAELLDTAQTARDVAGHYRRDNAIAAESALLHMGGRTVGGLGGVALGAGAAGAAGLSTGPGAILFGVGGGIAGAFIGDKFAAHMDARRIYNQQDGNGDTWRYDPDNPQRGWVRVAGIDASNDGVDNGTRGQLRASPQLESRLSYQASNVSVGFLLGNPPRPKDPYTQPEAAGDSHSMLPAPWTYNPVRKHWQREVVVDFNNLYSPQTVPETASAERAAQLDRAARQVVADNAALSPAAIAARYETHYHAQGWAVHGTVPEAVRTARQRSDELLASDGNRYQRQPDGRWVSEGMIYDSVAKGNLHAELEATHVHLQRTLPPVQDMPPPRQPTEAERLQGMIGQLYADGGIAADAHHVQAAVSAVQADRAQQGLPFPDGLQLKRGMRPDGLDSGFIHFRRESNGNLQADGETSGQGIYEAAKRLRQNTLQEPVSQNRQNTSEPGGFAPGLGGSRVHMPKQQPRPDDEDKEERYAPARHMQRLGKNTQNGESEENTSSLSRLARMVIHSTPEQLEEYGRKLMASPEGERILARQEEVLQAHREEQLALQRQQEQEAREQAQQQAQEQAQHQTRRGPVLRL